MSTFADAFSAVPLCIGRNDRYTSLFLTGDEGGKPEAIAKVKKHPLTAGADVALMTSGMLGLNFATQRGTGSSDQRRIAKVISVDYSSVTEVFWERFGILLKSSDDRTTLISALFLELLQNAPFYFTPDDYERRSKAQLDDLKDEIDNGRHFLSTDEGYAEVRKLFKEKRFVHLRADLADPRLTDSICCILQSRNEKLETLYLSNISDYANHEDRHKDFVSALEKLKPVILPDTIFIDSYRDIVQEKKPMLRLRRKLNQQSTATAFAPSKIHFSGLFLGLETHKLSEGPYPLVTSYDDYPARLSEARSKKVETARSMILSTDLWLGLNLLCGRGKSVLGSPKVEHLLVVTKHKPAIDLFAYLFMGIAKKKSRRQHCLFNLMDFLAEQKKNYFAETFDLTHSHAALGVFLRDIANGKHWLGNDDDYAYVYTQMCEGRIVIFGADASDPGKAQIIANGIKRSGLKLDSLAIPHFGDLKSALEAEKILRSTADNDIFMIK